MSLNNVGVLLPKLLSVVIPVYNGEKYLQQTIQSVLNSRGADFEVVVVNDGSADRTLEIAETLARQNPRVNFQIFSQANQGESAAINAGLVASRGEYVMVLSADDLVSESLFAESEKFFP